MIQPPAEIRQKTGLTQAQIAERLGLPLKTWQNWEQGRTALDPAVRGFLRLVADDPARAFRILSTGDADSAIAIAPEAISATLAAAKRNIML